MPLVLKCNRIAQSQNNSATNLPKINFKLLTILTICKSIKSMEKQFMPFLEKNNSPNYCFNP